MPVTIDSASLGELMGLAMKAQGLTQTDVAERVGCNQSQVSRLCRGQFDEETECLSQVCSVLKIRLTSQSPDSQQTLDAVAQLLQADGALRPSRRGKRTTAAAMKRRLAIERALRSIAALA